MYTKISALQAEALRIFMKFVHEVKTCEHIMGIEISQAEHPFPKEGDKKVVIIWQHKGAGYWQYVDVFFLFSEGSWHTTGQLAFAGNLGTPCFRKYYHFYERSEGFSIEEVTFS